MRCVICSTGNDVLLGEVAEHPNPVWPDDPIRAHVGCYDQTIREYVEYRTERELGRL